MAFGIRYFADLQSKFKGALWRVEIAERDYSGPSEEVAFEGGKPLQITWERRGDEFFVPVKASEAAINILCTENFKYIGLFTSDPRRFRVSVFRNHALYWRGYVVADLYSESFTAPPYQVSIKAVDGFNLLQSIPFMNLDGTQITGRQSLWSLLSICFDLLELELDVADWMDLYAEGMNESISPLRQVYVDMERFYRVYSEPSYRDVLELCLRPFAGQIFQSNGSLHIRRTISLYSETRPLSFYEIGTKFPAGFLVDHRGRELLTSTGDTIVTEATRDRIESMWNGGFDIMGESTMDIVPPLRKVTVTVKNKGMDNLIPTIGFYKLSSWRDPYGFLNLNGPTTLQFMGDGAHQNHVIETYGYQVQKCTYKLTLEYAIRAQHAKYGSSYSRSPEEYKIKFYYGLKVVGATETYWLQDDGQWVRYEGFMMEEAKTSTETTKKIEIEGIPVSGKLVFYMKQTLKYSVSTSNRYRYGEWEAVTFYNMSLLMDTGDEYENSLRYEAMVNHANNINMAIQLPIADIPNIPNDQLIYSLYFTNSSGKPTRMWHTRGGNDYNTLLNHLVQCALRYKQLPSRRISGNMFSGRHVDMNSVVQDSKYLLAGFYVNSIELKAVDDDYNVELVEMPGLVRVETPPSGDDCILGARFDFTVKTALLCGGIVVLLSTANKIYTYDPASKYVRQLLSYPRSVEIYPADNTFAVVDGTGASIVDYRGVVLKRYSKSGYNSPATYMGGYIYLLLPYTITDRDTGAVTTTGYYLNRPDYTYVSSTSSYSRGSGYNRTVFTGASIKSILKSYSAIAVNTNSGSWLHDMRVNEEMTATAFPAGTEIKTISDYFMAENLGSSFRIYRRDNFSDRTLIKSISGKADFADHTLGEVAYYSGGKLYIWSYINNAIRQLRNTAGASRSMRGLFYINGQLHIVRDNAIYKYIP
ncbi:hypothetical protein LJC45_01585 [Alistipes sp. OttesenSCG-928-B03]|nr:hypothetical protein [Alistipes sp. OttesenSCG-928-B03]